MKNNLRQRREVAKRGTQEDAAQDADEEESKGGPGTMQRKES